MSVETLQGHPCVVRTHGGEWTIEHTPTRETIRISRTEDALLATCATCDQKVTRLGFDVGNCHRYTDWISIGEDA